MNEATETTEVEEATDDRPEYPAPDAVLAGLEAELAEVSEKLEALKATLIDTQGASQEERILIGNQAAAMQAYCVTIDARIKLANTQIEAAEADEA